jgi:hypothetical protein
VGLREEIEAAFGEAAAQGGVRVLAIDGDEEVWVGGLAATDGTLEVRVGDRGPRRGLRPAVDALASGAEEVAFVSRVAGPNAVSMVAVGGRIRVEVLWPSDEPLELPGFDLDGDEKLSMRQVEPDEAVAAARTALDALGIGLGEPLLIHLGA